MSYDARQVSRWLDKTVGKSLVPVFKPSKTRAEQKRENLEKQMDKYDVTKQDDKFEKDKGTGLLLPPTHLGYSPAGGYMSAVFKRYMDYQTMMQWPTPDPDAVEKERKAAAEEKRRRIQAFSDSIASVAAARSEILESQPPAKPMPDYIQCLTGWRAWQVKKTKLESLGVTGTWHPRHAIPAVCTPVLPFGRLVQWLQPNHKPIPENHAAPHADCSCGYWSFKTQDLLTQALGSYIDNVTVVGTVSIWGKVIECENGYRSEYAYPKELWLLKPGLEHLSWEYGVPVRRLP